MKNNQKMNDMNVNANTVKMNAYASSKLERACMALRAEKSRVNQNAFSEAVSGLVKLVANKYEKDYRDSAVEKEDFISEGMMAAFAAVDSFDGRGTFEGYAISRIRFAILNCISDYNGLVRLPEKQSLLVSKIKKEIGKLTKDLERTPTLDEVADSLKMDAEKIAHLYGLSSPIIDIDAGDDEKEECYARRLDTYGADDSLRELLFNQRDVLPYLDALSEKRRLIVCCYHGIDTEKLSFTAIGEMLNISHEATRQQYNKAIEQLRSAMEADGWNMCA